MWKRVLAIAVAVAAASGCVAVSARGTTDGEGETGEEATPSSADDGSSAVAAAAGPAKEGEACAFAPGLEPSGFAPGMPRVAAADGVVAVSQRADVEVAADGLARVAFEVVVANRGASRAEARVGYAFRVNGGGKAARSLDGFSFSEGLDVRRCRRESPEKQHAVWSDETAYVVVPIEPGAEARVAGQATFRLDRRSNPTTLLGYEDKFALNLKNFKWSYLKDPIYAAAADRLRPIVGTLGLNPGAAAEISVRTPAGTDWMRAMSHEPNAAPTDAPEVCGWIFAAAATPAAISFELNPDLARAEEVALFERLAAARPNDLRVGLHLAGLLAVRGDGAARVRVLEAVLAAWGGNAEAQLLAGGNDVRGAVYVALVSELDRLGRKAEAAARAEQGIAVVAALDKNVEVNRAAAAWLAGYPGKAR